MRCLCRIQSCLLHSSCKNIHLSEDLSAMVESESEVEVLVVEENEKVAAEAVGAGSRALHCQD